MSFIQNKQTDKNPLTYQYTIRWSGMYNARFHRFHTNLLAIAQTGDNLNVINKLEILYYTVFLQYNNITKFSRSFPYYMQSMCDIRYKYRYCYENRFLQMPLHNALHFKLFNGIFPSLIYVFTLHLEHHRSYLYLPQQAGAVVVASTSSKFYHHLLCVTAWEGGGWCWYAMWLLRSFRCAPRNLIIYFAQSVLHAFRISSLYIKRIRK